MKSEDEIKTFEEIFKQYHPKVSLFIAGFIQNTEAARDLAQDIFFSLWNNRDRLSSVENINAYIYRMARNVVFNYFKHEYVHQRFCESYISDAEKVAENPEELIFAKELQTLISLSVEQLPPKCRQVYTMSREEGLSIPEIAERLQISRRTVENYLTTALSEVRKVTGCLLLFF